MTDNSKINVAEALEEIGNAVLTTLRYEAYPYARIDDIIKLIDTIISDPGYLIDCEIHFKSSGSNYVLFFLSNILYNLKAQGELELTPDVLKWLGSVWKNFIIRNRSYQDIFMMVDTYKDIFSQYYPMGGSFVNQISNAHQVKQDYIDSDESDNKLKDLESFYITIAELLSWMKPTYFFLLDYYYEIQMKTGQTPVEGTVLEKEGLAGFGQKFYTYKDLAITATQALGVLEAVYLILKKKSSTRKIVTVDGKQKFLTTSEVYNIWLEKFNTMKKELTSLVSGT